MLLVIFADLKKSGYVIHQTGTSVQGKDITLAEFGCKGIEILRKRCGLLSIRKKYSASKPLKEDHRVAS
jgi:S-adenosylhomocysteine hydrolase